MSEAKSLRTYEALTEMGFRPDASVLSEGVEGLSFDFGNFKLLASFVTNLSAQPIVLFTGVISTPRTLVEIHFEMPQHVDSVRQCAAWVAWNLDQIAQGDEDLIARVPEWLEDGREGRGILPWVREMVEYEARPQCSVERGWLRFALNTLSDIVALADRDAEVRFAFDGSVLSIRCATQLVPMPAEGVQWEHSYTIPAGRLRRLPKRFTRAQLEVSVYNEMLHIGRRAYKGVAVVPGSGT